jgi:hypothetical protein
MKNFKISKVNCAVGTSDVTAVSRNGTKITQNDACNKLIRHCILNRTYKIKNLVFPAMHFISIIFNHKYDRVSKHAIL